MQIELSNDHVVLVDEQDYQWLNNYTWRLHFKGYAIANMPVNGVIRPELMHRAAVRRFQYSRKMD